MKNKILILGIAISGLTIAQENIIADTNRENLLHAVVDTTKVAKIVLKTKICGGNTSKNVPCKNKTKHESGKCHHHRN